MNFDYQKALEEILQELHTSPGIMPEDVPSIDLYMDQVTSLIEEGLSFTRRSSEDKILTKTMINNYAKNHLLPAPKKKKYTPEHVLLLVFIYYFKNVLSLQDIQTILEPLNTGYFGEEKEMKIADIYREVFSAGGPQIEQIQAQVAEYSKQSAEQFEDCPQEDQAFLRFFSLACRLSIDIYIRKRILEKLIDQIHKQE